ncbi:hypothetical protein Ahy_A02g005336 isoform J [Arachis hypogaea]|uniref:Ku70/Ku80 N-terminal alpha/beta domain-containing protein n=1 Tax=Arachis hypogaea TaxID=3818 RepID=A0A445E6V6_ARAHY|nr:hypothetical protein Ahy_A02g005336 isoform J [Arachis hypogaea]
MANKEALVLLLDVGPSMHSVIPVIEKLCSMLVQKKLIYNRHDKVGVVLFGTKETYNELTLELGGYRHVVVLKNLKDVDGDMVEALQKLPRGTKDGDCIHRAIGFILLKLLLVQCYVFLVATD